MTTLEQAVAAERERCARICEDALALWRAGSPWVTFQTCVERIRQGSEPMPLCWDPRAWEAHRVVSDLFTAIDEDPKVVARKTFREGANCIAHALDNYRFSWSNEAELQDGIGEAFEAQRLTVSREHQLSEAGRVDFFLHTVGEPRRGIAIEVKTKGSAADIIRQLHRYASHDDVLGVVLVSTSLRLRAPAELAGKPTHTIHLARLA